MMRSFLEVLPLFLMLGGSALASPVASPKENDDGVCLIANIHYSDPFFTRNEFRNGKMQHPEGLDIVTFIALLDNCCDEYERKHPGHCQQHGWCGDNHGQRGGDGWGWKDGVCLIGDIKTSNPFFTRNEWRNGRMQHPDGIDIDVVIALLDRCCDNYEHDHPGYCEQHGWCGHENESRDGIHEKGEGCEKGRCGHSVGECGQCHGLGRHGHGDRCGNDCGGWKDGLCIITDTHYSDPCYAGEQYKSGHMQHPPRIDVDIFVSLLDNCCNEYERNGGRSGILSSFL